MSQLALIAPIQFIVDVLRPVLVFIHDTLGVGWGMSIVLLTVAVRAAMAPLTVKQFKSMRRLVEVAPELKRLQEKYKDDKQRQQQELMRFYSENKVNPFASCLPLVAQLPFFVGLFYLLQSDLRLEICGKAAAAANISVRAGEAPPPCGEVPGSNGAEEFLFIPDLTAGAEGWVLAALLLLYVGSQLLSTVLTPSTPDRNQRMLMYGLPVVFAVFILFYEFPAGLLVYWITTNLWTVGQGYILRRKLGPIMPPKPADGEAAPEGGLLSRIASGTSGAAAPKKPAPATAKTGSGRPPPPPRKKKKRSGRRR